MSEMEFKKVILAKAKTFGSLLFTFVNFSQILDFQVPLVLALDFFPTAEVEGVWG
jgi:hypothetical protein